MSARDGFDEVLKLSTMVEVDRILRQSMPGRIPIEHALWDVGLIGEYLIYSEDEVRKVVKQPDFPTAIRISIGQRQGQARYKASEVIEWTLRQR